MKGFLKRTAALLLAGVLSVSVLAGCGSSDTSDSSAETAAEDETALTDETTGADEETSGEEITELGPVDADAIALSVDGMDITVAELCYYYIAVRTQLDYYYSLDWTAELYEGYTYGDYLKDLVESQLLQVIFWNTLVDDYEVALTEEDEADIEEDLETALAVLAAEDLEYYGLTDENLVMIMEHSVLAGKAMDAALEAQIAEFSEDDIAACTFMTVQHILFLTESEDETDSSIDAEEYNASQLALAEEVLALAQSGEDFETLAETYNEDSGFEYSLNVNGESPDGVTYVTEFVEGCWNLSEGDIAIVQTDYGYHVIKCISESDEELFTEAAEELALEYYSDIYSAWLTEMDPQFYEDWQNFTVTNDAVLTTTEETSEEETEADTDTDEAETSADTETDTTSEETSAEE